MVRIILYVSYNGILLEKKGMKKPGTKLRKKTMNDTMRPTCGELNHTLQDENNFNIYACLKSMNHNSLGCEQPYITQA